MRCLFISMLVLEKRFSEGKPLPVLPRWLHLVRDVAKASLL